MNILVIEERLPEESHFYKVEMSEDEYNSFLPLSGKLCNCDDFTDSELELFESLYNVYKYSVKLASSELNQKFDAVIVTGFIM